MQKTGNNPKEFKKIEELIKAIEEAIKDMGNQKEIVISRSSRYAIVNLSIRKENTGYGVYLFDKRIIRYDTKGIKISMKNWKEIFSMTDPLIYEDLSLPTPALLDEYAKYENDKNEDDKKEERKDIKIEEDEEEKKEEKEEKKVDKQDENIKIFKTDQEMNLDREITRDENLRMWLKRTMGVDARRLWRRKDSEHEYKYIIEASNGEKQELPISTLSEGKNTRQTIWHMTSENKFEKKDVDSLMLNKSSDYGIATDEPENILEDNTKTMIVVRLPGGDYISVEALQSDTRYVETANNDISKDTLNSSRSIYEMEEVADIANVSKNIDAVNEDRSISNDEIRLVDFLKKEGFSDKDIDVIIEKVYDGLVEKETSCKRVDEIVRKIKELKEKGYTTDEIETEIEGKTPWNSRRGRY